MKSVPKQKPWAGIIVSALVTLFLLADGVMKLIQPVPVVEATVKLGYPASVILPLGVVLTLCTILYAIPRTAVLGGVLLVGYLGGAVATHVRAGGPLFSVLFPVIVGVLVWGGLYLREERLRALVPLTPPPPKSESKKMLWAGRVLTILPALMLLFSAVAKLMKTPVAQEFDRLGYPAGTILGIGILELVCTILYLVPRTSVFGALLLTGYLGGATATHVRIGDPFVPPILGGMLIWLGLFLRDARLRALLPLRS